MRFHDNKFSQLLLDGGPAAAASFPLTGVPIDFGNTGAAPSSSNSITGTSNGLIINALTGKVIALDIAGSHIFQVSSSALTITDGVNIVLDTTTGTKIGTATSQKLGFFNATPVVQQAGTGTATGFTANAGTAVNDASTFTGAVGATAYRISDVVKALKNLGLLAA